MRVEVVPGGRKVGAFYQNDLEQLEKETVRPVFRCKLTQKHADSLGMTHVWVDASQMGTDSGNTANVMAYATSTQLALNPQRHAEL